MATDSARSAAAAREALEGYFAAANRASRGDDFDDFRARFADSCGLCLAQYTNFTSAYAAGQQAEGDLYVTWNVSIEDVSADSAVALSTVDTGLVVLRDAQGNRIAEYPSEAGVTTVWTLRQTESGDWLVIDARDLA